MVLERAGKDGMRKAADAIKDLAHSINRFVDEMKTWDGRVTADDAQKRFQELWEKFGESFKDTDLHRVFTLPVFKVAMVFLRLILVLVTLKDVVMFVLNFTVMLQMFIAIWWGVPRPYRPRYWLSTCFSLAFAIIYVLSPVDLIPDYIPVVGVLDDMYVVGSVARSLNMEIACYRNENEMVQAAPGQAR
eukprot:Hpha_TRINITY_DN9286_c0_g1::TRINITY_DN9286_c0_g1_i1::g.28619::m.28619